MTDQHRPLSRLRSLVKEVAEAEEGDTPAVISMITVVVVVVVDTGPEVEAGTVTAGEEVGTVGAVVAVLAVTNSQIKIGN